MIRENDKRESALPFVWSDGWVEWNGQMMTGLTADQHRGLLDPGCG